VTKSIGPDPTIDLAAIASVKEAIDRLVLAQTLMEGSSAQIRNIPYEGSIAKVRSDIANELESTIKSLDWLVEDMERDLSQTDFSKEMEANIE